MNKPPSTPARRGRGRPTRDETARLDDAVRHAALDLFLANGFEGTTLEEIAVAAGTTKVSIYSRYANKADLLRDVVDWAMVQPDWPYPEPPLPDSDDLEIVLAAVARTAMSRALHPSMVSLSRLVIAQIPAFPELSQRADATASYWRVQFIADLLRRHSATGEVVVEQPELMAELFLAMVAGMPARMASMGRQADEAKNDALLETAVTMFLRSLRP